MCINIKKDKIGKYNEGQNLRQWKYYEMKQKSIENPFKNLEIRAMRKD